jgi:hypothetical protein
MSTTGHTQAEQLRDQVRQRYADAAHQGAAGTHAEDCEIHRLLEPGGRTGISDVVAEDHLTPTDRGERGS